MLRLFAKGSLNFMKISPIGFTFSNRMSISSKLSSELKPKNSIELIECDDLETLEIMKNNMFIQEDFLSESEEKSLLTELEPYMKKLRYEFDHWDNAIHGYRETERNKWSDENEKILKRLKQFAFESFENTKETSLLNHVHILDLHENGYIKPHVDAVRFCGNTIAGLSLLSDSIMKLVNEKDKSKFALFYLKRRSLYIMRDLARYDFSHEVLKNDESYFRKVHVPRKRRMAVICRNQPDQSAHEK